MRILILAAYILVFTTPAFGEESVPDLLERAVFTEETVGDLAAAIEIYEEIVGRADLLDAYAAKALYRMGLCYEKVGDEAEAKRALFKLITYYPDQAALVSLARDRLAVPDSKVDLDPVPWVDGEELHLVFQYPGGLPLGKMVGAAEKDRVDGLDVWRLQVRRFMGNNRGVSNVVVNAFDFRPVSGSLHHAMFGTANFTFKGDRVAYSREGEVPDTLALSKTAYENESWFHLFRRLPLSPGYKATFNLFVSFSGQSLDMGIEVAGIDTLTVPAGTFPCYRLELSIKQTVWVSIDEHRYIVRVAMGGVHGDLAEIRNHKRREPSSFENDHIAFHLPADWVEYDQGATDEVQSEIKLQDPRGAMTARINIRATESDEPSLDASVASIISGAKKRIGSYAVRDASRTSPAIPGFEVMRYAADYELNNKAWVSYRTFLKSEEAWIKAIFNVPADHFDAAIQETLDGIVASIQTR